MPVILSAKRSGESTVSYFYAPFSREVFDAPIEIGDMTCSPVDGAPDGARVGHFPHAGIPDMLEGALLGKQRTDDPIPAAGLCGAEHVTECAQALSGVLAQLPEGYGECAFKAKERSTSWRWARYVCDQARDMALPLEMALDIIAPRFEPFSRNELREALEAAYEVGYTKAGVTADKIRAQHAAAKAERSRKALEQAAIRAENDEIVEVTLGELRLFGVRADIMANGNDPRLARYCHEDARKWGLPQSDGSLITLWGTDTMGETPVWPEIPNVEGSALLTLLPSTHVIRLPRSHMKNLGGGQNRSLVVTVHRVRAMGIDARPIRDDELLDGSTAEGRARISLFVDRILARKAILQAKLHAMTYDQEDVTGDWWGLLAEIAVRGLGVSILAAHDAFIATVGPWVREKGLVPSFIGPGFCPPPKVSQAQVVSDTFAGRLERAQGGGFFVGALELLPGPGDLPLDGVDPWYPVLARRTHDCNEIHWNDAKDAISKAGLMPPTWWNLQGSRLVEVLDKLGFEKKVVKGADGKPYRTFVRR